MSSVGLHVDRHTAPTSRREALEADVHAGLSSKRKTLPPKWFYDARGNMLFDEITRLPEYYPFRCEREVLRERAGEIAALSGADTLVELGSGTSEKTRVLLVALDAAGTLRRFVPFDVDETVLLQAGSEIAELHLRWQCMPSSVTSSITCRCSPRAAGACSPSWAARSATCCPTSARAS